MSFVNTDIIDIEGIGTVDISKVSCVGMLMGHDGQDSAHRCFKVIIDSFEIIAYTKEAHIALLTAMRGRP